MLSPYNYKAPSPYAMVILKILLKNKATAIELSNLTGMPMRRVRQQVEWLRTGGAVKRIAIKDRGMGRGQGGCVAVYGAVVVKI